MWCEQKSLPPGGRGTALAVVGECGIKGVRLFWASEKGKVAQAPSVTHPRATSLSEGGIDSANKLDSLMVQHKHKTDRPAPLHYFTPASAILRGLVVALALYLLMCYNEGEFM